MKNSRAREVQIEEVQLNLAFMNLKSCHNWKLRNIVYLKNNWVKEYCIPEEQLSYGILYTWRTTDS